MRSTSFLLASDRIIDYRVLFSYSIYAYAVLCYCREMHYIIYIYTSLRTLFINISRAKFYSRSHLSLILSLIKIVKNSTICISVSAYSTWLDSLISTDWLTHFCDYDSIIQPDPLLPWNILYVFRILWKMEQSKEAFTPIERNSRRIRDEEDAKRT